MTEQIISLIGAALILAAFGAQQLKKLSSESLLYALLNFFGATILAIIAFRARQMGLTVVETAWSIISFYAIIRSL